MLSWSSWPVTIFLLSSLVAIGLGPCSGKINIETCPFSQLQGPTYRGFCLIADLKIAN